MARHHSASEIKSEAKEANGHEGKIRAAHLLVKHKDSRRPSSWREVRLIADISQHAVITILGARD